MKKLMNVLVLVLMAACAFCLAGCDGSNVDVSSYESRIISLESALSDTEAIITDYEDRISSLETELSKLKSTSKTLQTKMSSVESSVTKISEDLENVKNAGDKSIQVYLADTYYLVVDDTFQLFYRSVIRAVDPYGYYLHVTCEDGHPYNRYFEFLPKKVGTYTLKLEVCDDNGNILGQDTAKLVVNANTTTTKKTILCIGDSLTSSGDWVSRGISKYAAAGGTPTTVGTIKKVVSGTTYLYEGRAGWQWSSYLTKYDANTMSPFAPTGSNPSIRDYCTKNGFGEITDFYIMMTFNGLPGRYTEFTWDMSFIAQAKTLIDLIHREYPNAKISLMNLPLTSTKSGLGAYYKASLDYSDNYGKAVTVLHYGDFLEQWCKRDDYKSFMRYIDIKAQFDSEYNMPYSTKDVNNTNSTVKEEVGTSMGLHPTTAGYYQIGDAVYRALMANW